MHGRLGIRHRRGVSAESSQELLRGPGVGGAPEGGFTSVQSPVLSSLGRPLGGRGGSPPDLQPRGDCLQALAPLPRGQAGTGRTPARAHFGPA